MVKFLGKKEVFANGKIIATDFKDLDPSDFKPLYDLNKEQLRSETIICAPNGSLFVNRKKVGYEFMAKMFETLMAESKATLLEYEREYKKIYSNIKNFDDWAEWAKTEPNKEKAPLAMAVLLVPIELKRREIERRYYGKIIAF